MNSFFQKISTVLKDPMMRKRIGFTLLALIIFRFLSSIPLPGVDVVNLEKLLASNQIFGLFDIFSGGGISNLSIVALGVGPYITGSIIIQLFTMMFPSMKAMMQEEGEAGRMKLSNYSRLISIPLAVVQGGALLSYLKIQGVITQLSSMDMIVNIFVIVAGSVFLMWLGELVSEFGIGNGVSLVIFAGIIAVLPTKAVQFVAGFTDASDIPTFLLFVVISVLVVLAVVVVTEAERPVGVTYAKQVRGNKVYGGVSTYLPLRLNQAGVIPIIFALSILLFPQMISTYLAKITSGTVATISTSISTFLTDPLIHGILYFILVFVFTYFYTAVTFDPKMISENLQKGGAFIPGVRPGDSTRLYLGKIVTRITLVGAAFLGFIAVLPNIMQGFSSNQSLAIGGTALLIVVSVVLDLLKKIDAQASMREF